MKKITVATFALFGLMACQEMSTSAEKTDETMKTTESFEGRSIAFYNVENLFDTKNDPSTNDDDFTPSGYKQWDEERYEEKLDRLADAIEMIPEKPVLIGLAEIENRTVLYDLIEEDYLEDLNLGIVHFDSPDRRGIDCALLFDKTVFSPKHKRAIAVRIPGNRHFTTRDILYVEGEMNGEVLHVFVNHWSSRREGTKETEHKRIQAATILRKEVDKILDNNEKANIVIVGDFNDYPTDESLQFVLRAKESGYEGQGDLINLLFDEHTSGEGTSVHNREWSVLDQIIISQAIYDGVSGIGVEDKDAEILRENKLIYTYKDGGQKPSASYGGRKYYGGYSDHLPVYIVLKERR